jgi:molybdate transport system ATP-binding protein
MALEIDIKKTWPGFSLRVRLKAGDEIVGFLGASGSGKSMTLKCIAGIETPDEGVIIADGVPLFDSDKKINLPPQRRQTGYLFQSAALFPNMTAGENIRCVLRHVKNRSEKQKHVMDILRRMGLEGLQDRYPSELSGGQQQRVALGRILISQPKLILLDEPFSALDSYLRWQLEQELAGILSEFGGTSILVSHNRDEVYRLCGRLAVIAGGAIVAEGDKWDIFNNPKSYDACLLTGCKNISPARPVSAQSVTATNWDLTLDCAHDITGVRHIGIRAHDIILTNEQGRPNTFKYEIVSTLRDTFSYILMLRKKGVAAATPLRLELSREKYEALQPLPGYMYIPPEKILILDL